MLFVQVILGGGSTLLSFPINYHIIWGALTFVVLVFTTGLGAREYGRRSNLVKVGIAAILVFVLQGLLGLAAFSSDTVIVVHLANAFILGTLITYFIIFADSGEKALASQRSGSSSSTGARK